MTSYTAYGFFGGDASNADMYRARLPVEKLPEVMRWAVFHRFDGLLIQRTDDEPFNPQIVHHVCSDIRCPGGCGYAEDRVCASAGGAPKSTRT